MKEIHIWIVIVLVYSTISSYAMVTAETQISRETIDNAGRREYTYCPLSDSDVKSMNAEINGCPLVRIYINEWNKLSTLEQTSLDSKLRSLGFVDSSEHIIK